MHIFVYTFICVCACVCLHVRADVCVFFTVDNASCFSLTVHQNYIGTDAEKNPFFLSVVLSDQNNQRVPQYHSILWRKTVRNEHLSAALTFLLLFSCLFSVCLSYTFLLFSEFQYLIHTSHFIQKEHIILP